MPSTTIGRDDWRTALIVGLRRGASPEDITTEVDEMRLNRVTPFLTKSGFRHFFAEGHLHASRGRSAGRVDE